MSDVLIWITCRNYEMYLAQSEGSALRQGANVDILVSHDDCGGSRPIGAARNRNLILKRKDLSNYRYVIFFDADDYLPTSYVQHLLRVAKGDECVVACNGQEFGIRSGRICVSHPITLSSILTLNTIHISSLISTSILQKYGGFDPDLDAYEDWDFWCKLKRAGVEFRYCAETCLLIRKHSLSRHETKKIGFQEMSTLINARYGGH